MQIKEDDLDKFREIIYKHTGILINKNRNYLLSSRLRRILQNTVHNTPAEFYHLIDSGDQCSIDQLIHYATTNHTFFFREKSHFDLLRNDIIKHEKKNILIWSAASSTGEEAYSIAIYLLENNIDDFSILASDIKKEVLSHSKKGIYHSDQFHKTPGKYIRKYFSAMHREGVLYYKIKPEIKKYVKTRKINLIKKVDFQIPFDYIFCRNVMIYFDKKAQRYVAENLISNLNSCGLLFIGHSENMYNICDKVVPIAPAVYEIKK